MDKKRLPVIDMVKTGQNIIMLRRNAGLSVTDLKKIFGFSTGMSIYRWQKGTALPTIDNLVVLADVLGVKMEDIIAIDRR